MTASDHLKQATGSLGRDQQRIDISNLRFYAQMAREFQWQTDVIHWSVVEQTLNEVAQRTEAALAQKTRECEEQDKEWWVRLGKFRKALHEAGLHGHYNLLQEHFEDESGQWERLVVERDELRAQVEQLGRQVAEHEQNLRKSYRAGFEDCRNKALRIVDEHEGYSDRVEAATPDVNC